LLGKSDGDIPHLDQCHEVRGTRRRSCPCPRVRSYWSSSPTCSPS